jgi:hypothetical protein
LAYGLGVFGEDCAPEFEEGAFDPADPAFPPFAPLELPGLAEPAPVFAPPAGGVVAVLPGAAPVVAGAEVGAVVATGRSPPVQPAHHQTPMPIAISTMMPTIQAPELSVPAGRRRLFGS